MRRQPIYVRYPDMVDQVDGGYALATSSIDRLDIIICRMNNLNCGVKTSQMINNMGGEGGVMASMRNVKGGLVRQISDVICP